jgi:hypothetical protein
MVKLGNDVQMKLLFHFHIIMDLIVNSICSKFIIVELEHPDKSD